jgi:thiol-disulfide isomerase/thioredoxin
MKKLVIFILTCLVCRAGYPQQDETAVSINNIQQIPAFNIVRVPDSTGFSSRQLIKQAPLVLVFFNPDCDHCQQQVKELLAHKSELKRLQIVMVSALPYSLIKTFYENYQVASMPNVIMGQDENFVLGGIYKPARYPSLYIYDAGGSLAKVFAGNVTAAVLLNAVQ